MAGGLPVKQKSPLHRETLAEIEIQTAAAATTAAATAARVTMRMEAEMGYLFGWWGIFDYTQTEMQQAAFGHLRLASGQHRIRIRLSTDLLQMKRNDISVRGNRPMIGQHARCDLTMIAVERCTCLWHAECSRSPATATPHFGTATLLASR